MKLLDLRIAGLVLGLLTIGAPQAAHACILRSDPLMPENQIEFLCTLEERLPFKVQERWLDRHNIAFSSQDQPIKRRERYKTIMVFETDGAPINDLSKVQDIAERMARLNRCEIEDGATRSSLSATFVLRCPL